LTHPTKDLSRDEEMEAERRIALDISLSFESRADRVSQWRERTGKSQAAFYRRLNEIKQVGHLPGAD
jgi:NAD-specific glutamate dehydrogenase